MPETRADDELMAALERREHYFRNAVEGEYDANLIRRARHALLDATRPAPPSAQAGEDAVERVARALYCAGEGVDEAHNQAHLDYWFCHPVPNDTGLAEEYRVLARAALAALAAMPDPEPGNRMPSPAALQAAWHDGWAECRSRLTEDEAYCITEDVMRDAWCDCRTREISQRGRDDLDPEQIRAEERARIVAIVTKIADEHERSFGEARARGDDAAIDRCAARTRTAQYIADAIERGEMEARR